jgi:hypothetical protein
MYLVHEEDGLSSSVKSLFSRGDYLTNSRDPLSHRGERDELPVGILRYQTA